MARGERAPPLEPPQLGGLPGVCETLAGRAGQLRHQRRRARNGACRLCRRAGTVASARREPETGVGGPWGEAPPPMQLQDVVRATLEQARVGDADEAGLLVEL